MQRIKYSVAVLMLAMVCGCTTQASSSSADENPVKVYPKSHSVHYHNRDNDAQAINAEYISGLTPPMVRLNDGRNPPISLPQTEAGAEGAEYASGAIKWRVQKQEATFSYAGKETVYQELRH